MTKRTLDSASTPDDLNPLDHDSTPAQPAETFADFGLKANVMRGVEDAGFKVPSPIQAQAIPIILDGHDLIGQAHTGTGKTAAFGLPALNRLSNTGRVEVIIITPTRELATQVSDEIFRLGKFLPVKSVAVYGGQPYGRQIEMIRRGAQVVVATPGRLLDLLDGGRLSEFFTPSIVVLDEADEMLDMGFIDDVKKILAHLPETRQTLLFSATMPKPVQELAEKFMSSPKIVKIVQREEAKRDIQQQYYIIDEHERDDATMRLMDSLEPSRAMVFCRTKSEVDRLAGMLAARGVPAQAFHGDMDQAMRERALKGFRNGDFTALVATDVAARGIDVAEVTHVFNYHIPFDTESYVHRIGRTGRAGRTGVAITLVTPREYHGLRRIQHKMGLMEQNFIPTHGDLKTAIEGKLLESIRLQPVDVDAERFIATLEDELGLAQAANKMAALLLARDAIAGPDKIGLPPKRVEKLKEGAKATKGKKPFGRGDDRPRKFGGPRGRFGKADGDTDSRSAKPAGRFGPKPAGKFAKKSAAPYEPKADAPAGKPFRKKFDTTKEKPANKGPKKFDSPFPTGPKAFGKKKKFFKG